VQVLGAKLFGGGFAWSEGMNLRKNQAPPRFSSHDTHGRLFELGEVLGKHRLLLAFHAPPDWIESVAAREGELRDYDLQVLVGADEDEQAPHVPPESSLRCFADWSVSNLFEAQGFCGALVGNDGTVKELYFGQVDLDAALALIDTMPMRRREVQQKDGSVGL
jgi:hypothetical protein